VLLVGSDPGGWTNGTAHLQQAIGVLDDIHIPPEVAVLGEFTEVAAINSTSHTPYTLASSIPMLYLYYRRVEVLL
jgi:hypothetical protein